MKQFVLVLHALLSFAAGATGQVVHKQTAGKPNRIVAKGEWQVVRNVGLDTDLFEQPIALAAAGDRFVVVDGDAIHSFTVTGNREWRFGRTGSGPGEFRQILSLAMDTAGNTLIYDGALERLTVIDRKGSLRRVVPLPSRTDRAVFSSPGRYLLLNTASDTLSRVVDSAAIVGGLYAMPADLHPFEGLSREMASIIPISGGYLVTFRWSSRMLTMSPAGVVTSTCTGIDSLSFPDVIERPIESKIPGIRNLRSIRVEPRARPAVFRATMLGDQLLVEPSIPKSGRHVVDLYARDCGKYVGSRPFPYQAIQLAGTRNLLIAMLDEPVPHVVVLRWVPR